MGNYLLVFIGGFFLALLIDSIHDKSIKTECESNLPRTQQCVLVAVPEAKNETLNNHTTDSDSANR